MKATQLRLGNYLQGKNTVVKVTRIFNEDEIGIGSGDPYIVSGENPCLLPIPLTEEWLLKCGFKTGFSDLQFMIRVTKDCSMAIWINNHNDNCMIGDELELTIKYLHQLQNLFWILTGEELNIEL